MIDETAVGALDGAFAGVLIGPSHREYESARRVWNGMVDRRPALIARCAHQGDVVAAVRFAREHGLPLAVRSGGHNVAGNAVCDGGVVVDLSAQRAVEVDPVARTARSARARCSATSTGRPRPSASPRRPETSRSRAWPV